MKIENIFDLIKQTVNLSGYINDYQIKLSNGRFERENMIRVYKIRERIAFDNENHKLANQLHQLIIDFESYPGILLKGVTIENKNYIGTFYLSEDWNKVIGYLESEVDDNGNIIN